MATKHPLQQDTHVQKQTKWKDNFINWKKGIILIDKKVSNVENFEQWYC